jgi:hypothetical protein
MQGHRIYFCDVRTHRADSVIPSNEEIMTLMVTIGNLYLKTSKHAGGLVFFIQWFLLKQLKLFHPKNSPIRIMYLFTA